MKWAIALWTVPRVVSPEAEPWAVAWTMGCLSTGVLLICLSHTALESAISFAVVSLQYRQWEWLLVRTERKRMEIIPLLSEAVIVRLGRIWGIIWLLMCLFCSASYVWEIISK